MSITEFLRDETVRKEGTCYPIESLRLLYGAISRIPIGRCRFAAEVGRHGIEVVESPGGELLALHRSVC